MRSNLKLLALGLALLGGSTTNSSAVVSVYSTRTSFDAAFPGLPVETFEAANVGPAPWASFPGPLDKFTSNDVFSPGQILDGLRITTGVSSISSSNVFVSSAGFANYTSHAISYRFGDTPGPELAISLYNGNVTALGLDVTSNPDGHNVTLELFSSSGSLGSYVVSNAQGSGTFIGFFSPDPILSVQLTGSADFYGVDNIAFNAVPEPYPAALLTLGLVLVRRRCLLRTA